MLLTLPAHTARPWISGLSHSALRVFPRPQVRPEFAHFSKACYSTASRTRNRWLKERDSLARDRFSPSLSLISLPRYHSTLPEMSSVSIPAARSVDEYRLLTNVKPTHYDLTVKTDLEKLEFDGFVKIRWVLCLHSVEITTLIMCSISLDVHEETSSISLNTSDLELGKACVQIIPNPHYIYR